MTAGQIVSGSCRSQQPSSAGDPVTVHPNNTTAPRRQRKGVEEPVWAAGLSPSANPRATAAFVSGSIGLRDIHLFKMLVRPYDVITFLSSAGRNPSSTPPDEELRSSTVEQVVSEHPQGMDSGRVPGSSAQPTSACGPCMQLDAACPRSSHLEL